MRAVRCRRSAAVVIVLASFFTFPAGAGELTLERAEALALEQAPALARLVHGAAAAAERVVYEGRLPDPALTLGAINVPTDSFSLREDDMTMVGVGLRQAFPPGDTLAQRTRRAAASAERETARLEGARRRLVRDVRAVWFELYAAEQSLRLHQEALGLARRDLASTEARYRAAQEPQRAVLQARSAVARLHEREPMLHAQARRARAVLARYIGAAARDSLPSQTPALPAPGDFDAPRHPELRAAAADVDAMRAEIGMANAEYKPGYMIDVMYGVRQDRPDMITAQIGIDLPLFQAKRQDRRVAERAALAQASELEAEDRARDLAAAYESARAEHDALHERLRIYENDLLPALKREGSVTIAGFARDQTELRAARMKELDARMELIMLKAALAKSQAELLYLTGE